MNREDLKDIICRVIDKMKESDSSPVAGCIFTDNPCDSTLKYGVCDTCDTTSRYAIGEEG